MQSIRSQLVILGTGGTIAGTAAAAQDQVGYDAAQLGVEALVAGLPAMQGLELQIEQVAQIDSREMSFAVWQKLALRVAWHLARPEVCGLIVTHGTDTLEETAYFLHRVLAPAKPVVLSAAMRPATALLADGPQNLIDAVTLAAEPGACGVMAVLGGDVFSAVDLRKSHTLRLGAFSSGDAGLVGRIENGVLRRFREWPGGAGCGPACIAAEPDGWPRVEIVFNHVAADGRIVDALLSQGIDGLVLAGTGNGTLSAGLEAAALRARAAGVRVVRTSRCLDGPVIEARGDRIPGAGPLTAFQARIEIVLQCLQKSLPKEDSDDRQGHVDIAARGV